MRGNFCTLDPHFPEATYTGPDVEECRGEMIRRRTAVATLSASLRSLEATTACNTLSLALRETDICIPLGSMDPGAWLFCTSHSHSFDRAESFAKSSCPSWLHCAPQLILQTAKSVRIPLKSDASSRLWACREHWQRGCKHRPRELYWCGEQWNANPRNRHQGVSLARGLRGNLKYRESSLATATCRKSSMGNYLRPNLQLDSDCYVGHLNGKTNHRKVLYRMFHSIIRGSFAGNWPAHIAIRLCLKCQ